MGATASGSTGTTTTDFELLEGGVYPARCIQVVELGTHKNTHPQAAPDATKKELLLIWEVSGELMADGRPFTVNKRYTNSLGEKAILRKDLASWRGRDFTPEELNGFAMSKILDAPCLLNITKKAGAKDPKKFYNNVMTIMPLSKGMTVAPRINDLVDFGIQDRHDDKLMEKIWPWVRKIITESYEAQGLLGDRATSTNNIPDDDIPF